MKHKPTLACRVAGVVYIYNMYLKYMYTVYAYYYMHMHIYEHRYMKYLEQPIRWTVDRNSLMKHTGKWSSYEGKKRSMSQLEKFSLKRR